MSTFDEPNYYKKEELLDVDWRPPRTPWMDTAVDFRPGTFIYPGKAKNLKIFDLPNPREWVVTEGDYVEVSGELVEEAIGERAVAYRDGGMTPVLRGRPAQVRVLARRVWTPRAALSRDSRPAEAPPSSLLSQQPH